MNDAQVMSVDQSRHGSLREVLPSVMSALGAPSTTDSLGLDSWWRGGRGDPITHCVVLLVDGMGWHPLRDDPTRTPTLSAGDSRVLKTAFPSTTPVGLGSFGTGLSSGGHGMVGATFRLPETGHVLHPLSWGDDPAPQAVQPEPTVFEQAARAGIRVTSVGPRAFGHSGLTRAVLRGGDYRGSDSVGERVAEVARATLESPGLTYVYWGDLDKTGHVHGVDSVEWRAELQHVDDIVRALVRVMPVSARLLVTADHGMVDCPEDARIDVDTMSLREGVECLAGEPRMRHVYAKHGAAEDVAQTWAALLGDSARVLLRHEAIAAGLFGEVEDDYRGRIGDVIAIAHGNIALVSQRTDSIVSSLRGQHGSLTEREVDIPLILLTGEG